MTTLTDKIPAKVQARSARFLDDVLYIRLSDGREVSLPLRKVPWLQWLLRATPEQRAKWTIEPHGMAIYWEDLDDGIEVCHLLAPEPVA